MASGTAATHLLQCREALASETDQGLRLVLGLFPQRPGEPRMPEIERFIRDRKIDTANLCVAVHDGKLLWALLPVLSPGRTALLLGANQHPPEPAGLKLGKLIELVCQRIAAQDVQLAQVLLDPADRGGISLFASGGFELIAELLYLQCAVPSSSKSISLPEGWMWQTYSAETHAIFARAIEASYQQSLDCPALNGLRDLDDVIAGHRASGEFDPHAWFVLTFERAPMGVVLVNKVSQTDLAELVYLGVSPAARGHGVGATLFRQALLAASALRARRVTLAVDSLNAPALRLYYRHGMQQVGSKLAMLRNLRLA